MSKIVFWVALSLSVFGIYNIVNDTGNVAWKENLRFCNSVANFDSGNEWRCVADANKHYDDGVKTFYAEAIGGGTVAVISGIMAYKEGRND